MITLVMYEKVLMKITLTSSSGNYMRKSKYNTIVAIFDASLCKPCMSLTKKSDCLKELSTIVTEFDTILFLVAMLFISNTGDALW